MIEHTVEQGSLAWLQLRIGRPTASEFEKIITPAKLQFSKSATKYACRLIAERLLNQSADSLDHLEHIARGKELEPVAARAYEFETGFETRKVGFVTTDDGLIGASPDRIITTGSDLRGGLEIKCPSGPIHVEHLYAGFGDDYKIQVQGQMLVGELDFVDRYSFIQQGPSLRVRTYRDEAVIKALQDGLRQFLDLMADVEAKALSAGVWTPSPSLVLPEEVEYAEAFSE
jgi:hypothetical protein